MEGQEEAKTQKKKKKKGRERTDERFSWSNWSERAIGTAPAR